VLRPAPCQGWGDIVPEPPPDAGGVPGGNSPEEQRHSRRKAEDYTALWALCTAVAGQHYSSRAYSTFARGLDGLWGAYHWLDRAPKGRNDGAGYWWRHHDEYDKR
jgi:predicted dithiol-disulfide oxidoreductase (DUF899 family)